MPEASEAEIGWDLPEAGAAGCNLTSPDSIHQDPNYVYGCNSRQCLKNKIYCYGLLFINISANNVDLLYITYYVNIS